MSPSVNPPSTSVDDLLDAVPVANTSVRSVDHGDRVTLYVPLRSSWWNSGLMAWVLPMRKERGVELDKIGTAVWRQCDGTATLEQIIDRFAQEHRLRFNEARLAVTQFVRSMTQRNLVAMVVRKPQENTTA